MGGDCSAWVQGPKIKTKTKDPSTPVSRARPIERKPSARRGPRKRAGTLLRSGCPNLIDGMELAVETGDASDLQITPNPPPQAAPPLLPHALPRHATRRLTSLT